MAGAFGSGKSEIAVNHAVEYAQQGIATVLADLDMANPYFVSRDAEEILTKHNIRLLAPDNVMAYGDVPNLPPGIIGILRQNMNTVVDLAGDKAGALILGYLAKFINPADFRIYLIINPYRPFSWDLQDIVDLKNMLECAAGRPVNRVISNPHLVEATDLEVIIRGHRRVAEIASQLGLSISNLMVSESYYKEACFLFGDIVKELHLYLRPKWL